jgi:MoxR-like ATPase
MKALIAASNELPAEDEGLEALWDRFLVRMVSNCISNEKTFYKMVRSKSIDEPVIAENYLVDDALHLKWLAAIHEVEITDEICRLVTNVRKIMAEQQKKEEITTLDYYISDRRWKKIFHLMQASAFLNGRNAINVTDSILLIHCLWNKVDAIPVVLDAVCSAITADLDGKITQNVKALDKLIAQLSANMQQGRVSVDGAEEDYVVMNHFYYIVEGFQNRSCLFARFDYNHIDTKKPIDGILYYEDKSKSWIIHAIYTGAPFDYKMSSGKITKVKLQKCKNGIMVDGIPYLFKKKGRGFFNSEPNVPSSTCADILFTESASIRSEWRTRQTLWSRPCRC